MKIEKLYDDNEIIIKYRQLKYNILLNKLIYKRLKSFICKNEILILILESKKYISIDMIKKEYCWRSVESEIKCANYAKGSIVIIDLNNVFWIYEQKKHCFERWYNVDFLRFYEISAFVIKKDFIYIYDNYSNFCYKINMEHNAFNAWNLKKIYDGNEYYINRINKIVIRNGINLYDGNSRFAVIKEDDNIIYEEIKGNIFHYPRGIFLYNDSLGVCNTYANNILLINKELKRFEADFCIQKPRWMDIEGHYFAICDGTNQKIILGEIDEYRLKKKKELLGFFDIHSCKIVENFVYVIDAESSYLSKIDVRSGKRTDYNLDLKDAHSIKITSDRKKLVITDSGNNRILCTEIGSLKKQYIYSIDIENMPRKFYMPRALAVLDSSTLVYTIGYGGNLFFYDLSKKKVIKYIKIKEMEEFIDKARDMLISEDKKSIFFSLTEQSAVIQVKFSHRICLSSIKNIKYTEIICLN